MTVEVDLSRCAGHARCVHFAPTIFTVDDESGQAIVIAPDPDESLRPALRRAASNCPERAITIDQ